MFKSDVPPFLTGPVYKDYVWGGRWIPDTWPRAAPDGKIAESWEVSAHPDGMSMVDGGPLNGRSLESLVIEHGMDMVGWNWHGTRFPLLVKLIDAEQTLSVQVHPDDETAARYGGEAKTEMWYILDATPEACVYCGFNRAVRAEDLDPASQSDPAWIESCLQRIPVSAGDVIFVPGGRVHAIGAGCRLLEVQQNSNTTYRLYDWGRTGDDGKPRPLHVEQAARVIDYRDVHPAARTVPGPLQPVEAGHATRELLRSGYFVLGESHFNRPVRGRVGQESFTAWFARRGALKVESEFGAIEVPEGRTLFLPAGLGDFTAIPAARDCEVISISLPE